MTAFWGRRGQLMPDHQWRNLLNTRVVRRRSRLLMSPFSESRVVPSHNGSLFTSNKAWRAQPPHADLTIRHLYIHGPVNATTH